MMTLQQYLLTKLAEEAAEIGQIALKTQQFGFSEQCPGQPYTNAERTHQELDDLMAVVEMLNDVGFGYEPNRDSIEAKKVKVVNFLRYSVELEMVDHRSTDEYESD